MELRQLRYFLTVADEGSFSRAAERVGVTQPNLSKQIGLLEQELGVTLLTRTVRGTDLTPAGRVLLARARQLLELQAATWRDLHPYRETEDQRLRVGVPDAEHVMPIFAGILREFTAACPQVSVARVQTPWIRHAAELGAGLSDVGFGLSVEPDDYPPEIASARLVPDPSGYALLAEHHGLSRRERLEPADLRHLPLYVTPAGDMPALRRHQLGALHAAGYDSPVASTLGSFSAAVAAVAAGSGWLLTSQLIAEGPPPGTATVPLRGVHLSTGYDVLWRRNDRRSTVALFVRVCRAAFTSVPRER